jgi:desulfoferrodoxin (superoxide reductase-like protein)
MMCKAKVAVCSAIHTKHPMQSEHHVEFLDFKPDGT